MSASAFASWLCAANGTPRSGTGTAPCFAPTRATTGDAHDAIEAGRQSRRRGADLRASRYVQAAPCARVEGGGRVGAIKGPPRGAPAAGGRSDRGASAGPSARAGCGQGPRVATWRAEGGGRVRSRAAGADRPRRVEGPVAGCGHEPPGGDRPRRVAGGGGRARAEPVVLAGCERRSRRVGGRALGGGSARGRGARGWDVGEGAPRGSRQRGPRRTNEHKGEDQARARGWARVGGGVRLDEVGQQVDLPGQSAAHRPSGGFERLPDADGDRARRGASDGSPRAPCTAPRHCAPPHWPSAPGDRDLATVVSRLAFGQGTTRWARARARRPKLPGQRVMREASRTSPFHVKHRRRMRSCFT